MYNEIAKYPPEGYEYVTGKKLQSSEKVNDLRLMNSKLSYSWLNYLLDYFRPRAYYLYYRSKEKQVPAQIDLTYSSQHLVFRKEPWVVDMEHVGALAAYGQLAFFRSTIEKMLASKYCKKIIPWSNVGKRTLFLNLDCRKFEDKIKTVRLAVHPKKFQKKHDHPNKVVLLFVGTVNSFNLDSSFHLRGGQEVLAAFELLSKEYPNLELVMRSAVPKEFKVKYRHLSKSIRIVDRILPWDYLEQIFKSADIFLFPGHTTPGMTILDAMSYELPTIATNIWGNSEVVKEGRTGFLIRKSEKIPYFMKSPRGIIYYNPAFLKAIQQKPDSEVVKELAEKIGILVEDEQLRKKMGWLARQEIEIGEFSIKKRNEALKGIYEDAISA